MALRKPVGMVKNDSMGPHSFEANNRGGREA